MTERRALRDFFAGKKRYLMESFYRSMRKRYDILMDRDKPVGGQWNYDQKNRQAYDGQVAIPRALLFKNDVSDICRTIQKVGVKTFGEIEPDQLIWPTSRAQSLKLLKAFIKRGLAAFGTYQDAMTVENWHLFHSRLSFALNTKMLRPLEVIQAVLRAWESKKSAIQIHQVEGFVDSGVLGGVFWGVIFGLVFWAKWWGLSVGGAVGELGLDDEFVSEVGDAIGRGHSALFLLAGDNFMAQLEAGIPEHGAQVMAADLDPNSVERLKEVFG